MNQDNVIYSYETENIKKLSYENKKYKILHSYDYPTKIK